MMARPEALAAACELVGNDLIDWAAARLARFDGFTGAEQAWVFASAGIGVVMSTLCASGMPAARAAETVGAMLAMVAEDLA